LNWADGHAAGPRAREARNADSLNEQQYKTISDLAKEKTGLTTGLGREPLGCRHGGKPAEPRRVAGHGLAEGSGHACINEQTFNRTADWLGQKNNLETMKSAMEREDFGTLQNMLQGFNQDEIKALGCRCSSTDSGVSRSWGR